nr:hypothetical protein [Tanacetum cinerariifolium]
MRIEDCASWDLDNSTRRGWGEMIGTVQVRSTESVDADYAIDTEHLTLFDNQTSRSTNDDGRATPVEDDSANFCFATTFNKSVEPSCLSDALSDPNWVDAMIHEIESC